ncbi:MAG: Arc family DNA-binding protein [Candidatus Aminicenantes bacterium]|nr:Arc family DNA-binding protein [Candidatus Aminicenantes bacterium]
MADKKKFLLRLDAELYDTLEKWAADELRSVNAEMEFLLKEAARKSGRLKALNPAPPKEESEKEPKER